MKYIVTIVPIILLFLFACKNPIDSNTGATRQLTLLNAVNNAWEMYEAIASSEVSEVDESIRQYAFSVLTPSGRDIFLKARRYVDVHKSIKRDNREQHIFAQVLTCALNVSHVFWSNDLNQPNSRAPYMYRSITQIEQEIKGRGGKVLTLPPVDTFDPKNRKSYYTVQDNHPLIDFFNQEGEFADSNKYLPPHFFRDGIPPGVVITGYDKSLFDASSGHSSIVGDLNHQGAIMIYSNNWYRPESLLSGRRVRHMVSLTNLYHGQYKPREWMATSWLHFSRDVSGKITKITQTLPGVDDLDPLNSNFEIRMSVPKSILDEMSKQPQELITPLTQYDLEPTNNLHILAKDPENKLIICQLNLSRDQLILDFFKANTPPAELTSETFRHFENFFGPGSNNKIKESRHLEIYKHMARNDNYHDYEMVTFYKHTTDGNVPDMHTFFLKKSVFSNHTFTPTSGLSGTAKEVICMTKCEMVNYNLLGT
ncbi:MAG: hypothetical protein OXC40_04300, partial [Proteobacteria bacterium]|nr:hypothetical protein [Pseudomonadota bacterium]